MKTATSVFLTKSRESLREATVIAGVGLFKVAARCAYYAAFHAAEALIYENSGKIAKTHAGVRSEFARVMKSDPRLARQLHAILVQGYTFKQISDYGPAEVKAPTDAEAAAAIAEAENFLETIEDLVRKTETES